MKSVPFRLNSKDFDSKAKPQGTLKMNDDLDTLDYAQTMSEPPFASLTDQKEKSQLRSTLQRSVMESDNGETELKCPQARDISTMKTSQEGPNLSLNMDTIIENSRGPHIPAGATSSSKRNPFEAEPRFETGQILMDSTEFVYDTSTANNIETVESRPTTFLTNNTKMSHRFRGGHEQKQFKAIDQRQIDLRMSQVQPKDAHHIYQSREKSRESSHRMKTPTRSNQKQQKQLIQSNTNEMRTYLTKDGDSSELNQGQLDQLMTQEDYQTYLRNKPKWESSNPSQVFLREPRNSNASSRREAQILKYINKEQYAWNEAVRFAQKNNPMVKPSAYQTQEALIVSPVSGLKTPQLIQDVFSASAEQKARNSDLMVDAYLEDTEKTSITVKEDQNSSQTQERSHGRGNDHLPQKLTIKIQQVNVNGSEYESSQMTDHLRYDYPKEAITISDPQRPIQPTLRNSKIQNSLQSETVPVSEHASSLFTNDAFRRRNQSQQNEELDLKNNNVIEMEDFVKQRITLPWQTYHQESIMQMQQFNKQMKYFREVNGRSDRDDIFTPAPQQMNDAQSIIYDLRYRSKINSSRQSTFDGKKREMKFSPKLSIYATNNGLSGQSDKFGSKLSNPRMDRSDLNAFFHMRLKTQSKENVLNQETSSMGNQTVENPSRYRRSVLLNETIRKATKDKLASVSIQYRRDKGRQMNHACDKKGVHDLNYTGLLDRPLPQQDQILKSSHLNKKMCPREFKYQRRNQIYRDEAFKPIYHVHQNVNAAVNAGSVQDQDSTNDNMEQVREEARVKISIENSEEGGLDNSLISTNSMMNRTIDPGMTGSNFPYNQTSMFNQNKSINQKDPTNIGYMCLKMKEQFINQIRLKSQRNTVRTLDLKYNRHRKENSMTIYQDEYHMKSLLQKQKQGQLLPTDNVCNGGYIKKYNLLQNNPGFKFTCGDELVIDNLSTLEQYNQMSSKERTNISFKGGSEMHTKPIQNTKDRTVESQPTRSLDKLDSNYIDNTKDQNVAPQVNVGDKIRMQAAKLASQQGQRVTVFTDINMMQNKRLFNAESMKTNGMTECTSKQPYEVESKKYEKQSLPLSGTHLTSSIQDAQINTKFDEFKIIKDIDVKLNQEIKQTKRVNTQHQAQRKSKKYKRDSMAIDYGRAINNSSAIMCNGQDIWTPPEIKESNKAQEDQTLEIHPLTISKVLSGTITEVKSKQYMQTKNSPQNVKNPKGINESIFLQQQSSDKKLDSLQSVSSAKFHQTGDIINGGTQSKEASEQNDYAGGRNQAQFDKVKMLHHLHVQNQKLTAHQQQVAATSSFSFNKDDYSQIEIKGKTLKGIKLMDINALEASPKIREGKNRFKSRIQSTPDVDKRFARNKRNVSPFDLKQDDKSNPNSTNLQVRITEENLDSQDDMTTLYPKTVDKNKEQPPARWVTKMPTDVLQSPQLQYAKELEEIHQENTARVQNHLKAKYANGNNSQDTSPRQMLMSYNQIRNVQQNLLTSKDGGSGKIQQLKTITIETQRTQGLSQGVNPDERMRLEAQQMLDQAMNRNDAQQRNPRQTYNLTTLNQSTQQRQQLNSLRSSLRNSKDYKKN